MEPFHGVSIQMNAYLDPKDLPQFWELFEPVFKKVIAEPHCTFFEVYQSPEEPGTISWVENWSKPKEWLLEHQVNKPYYAEYREIMTPKFLKPLEIKVWDKVGPKFTYFQRENGGLRE
ncbi:hypothetical protein BJX63DRAFT_427443 [Aspergillus granulosus]|uniref:ABM domain-containing protein n=1 Tax=Aspergillus granulosus TaxID=176169 RepID=A0ABR4I2V5_9EURO